MLLFIEYGYCVAMLYTHVGPTSYHADTMTDYDSLYYK